MKIYEPFNCRILFHKILTAPTCESHKLI